MAQAWELGYDIENDPSFDEAFRRSLRERGGAIPLFFSGLDFGGGPEVTRAIASRGGEAVPPNLEPLITATKTYHTADLKRQSGTAAAHAEASKIETGMLRHLVAIARALSDHAAPREPRGKKRGL